MISYDDLTVPQLLRRLVAGRFRVDGMNGVAAYDFTSPAEVLTKLRAHLRPRGLTAAGGGGIALTDGLIHHQDIRRALAAPREVPAERLLPALGFALKALALPSRRQVHGLHLVATDLDWAHGEGPLRSWKTPEKRGYLTRQDPQTGPERSAAPTYTEVWITLRAC